MRTVGAADIIAGLERLGIGRNSIIMVHSSLSSFGRVDGGAEAVIEALQAAVGVDGLVIMPTHAYCFTGRLGVTGYDPLRTPSETGTVPAAFWKRAEVLRSLHPTHSQAAWGNRAAEVLADHDHRAAVGADSPLHRAAQWGGTILQFGVTHTTNTTIHLAESLAEVPYLRIPFRAGWGVEALVRRRDGRTEVVPPVNGECPGASSEFDRLAPLLDGRKLTRRTTIGKALTAATPMAELVEVAVHELRRNPRFFLRNAPDDAYYGRAWATTER